MQRSRFVPLYIVAVLAVVLTSGCKTKARTGALAGGGVGALAGAAIGGSWQGALIGAGVGTGVGYIVGNEADKEKAAEMSRQQHQGQPVTHTEVGTLGGTRWKVISINPSSIVAPYASKIVEFKGNGRVVTTTTATDGHVSTSDESYRVVGDTLIVNKPGYLINAKFHISGRQLTVSADRFSAVFERL